MTFIVQLLPAEIGEFVQAVVTEKFADPAPLIVTLETVRGNEPQFVIVTLCTVLVVPINWFEKTSVAAVLKHTCGAGAVECPVKRMLRGLPV